MNAIEDYLDELSGALRVTGRDRRRLIAETRDHLLESGAAHGADEAVRRFGPAAELARSYGGEVAVRRATTAAAVAVLGVLAVGGSALAVVWGADRGATAVPAWAVAFFVCAQVAAGAGALAAVRALAMRFAAADAADAVLLCRRGATALLFALVTLFAAAAAVPGHAAAWQVLLGPVVGLAAGAFVLRARRLARRVGADPDASSRRDRSPFDDMLLLLARGRWADRAPGVVGTRWLFAALIVLAAGAAFGWDRLDQGSPSSAITAAAIEAGAALAGLLVLGRPLGLRAAPHRR